ncbi:hypothetical protein Pcinc_038993, partial [Petrolisthes cinctipes]
MREVVLVVGRMSVGEVKTSSSSSSSPSLCPIQDNTFPTRCRTLIILVLLLLMASYPGCHQVAAKRVWSNE